MLKYSPKVFLLFRLPDGSTHQGFYRKNQRLADIVAAILQGGTTALDQSKSVGELGLKNDTLIEVKAASRGIWPFRR